MMLTAPGVRWDIVDDGPNQTAVAHVQLDGTPLEMMLRLGVPGRFGWSETAEADRREATEQYWRDWTEKLTLPSTATEEVERSALVIKALCHQPSGAILAAATTSLPEVMGGVRNWDYRYCWPRDASMSAAALLALGSSQEACHLLDWILDRVEHLPGPEQLRPVYPLVGDEALPEAVLPELAGYAGSRPVRIGNAAEHQVQLDVFGPVVDLAWRLCEAQVTLTDQHWEVVKAVVGGGGRPLARARPRHLGGAPPAPPPRPLQGDVLDGGGPGHQDRRAHRPRAGLVLEPASPPDRRRCDLERVERAAPLLHHRLRLD